MVGTSVLRRCMPSTDVLQSLCLPTSLAGRRSASSREVSNSDYNLDQHSNVWTGAHAHLDDEKLMLTGESTEYACIIRHRLRCAGILPLRVKELLRAIVAVFD